MWEIIDSSGTMLGPFPSAREASQRATESGMAGALWKVRASAAGPDELQVVAQYPGRDSNPHGP
jgi:hypothetical protein